MTYSVFYRCVQPGSQEAAGKAFGFLAQCRRFRLRGLIGLVRKAWGYEAGSPAKKQSRCFPLTTVALNDGLRGQLLAEISSLHRSAEASTDEAHGALLVARAEELRRHLCVLMEAASPESVRADLGGRRSSAPPPAPIYG